MVNQFIFKILKKEPGFYKYATLSTIIITLVIIMPLALGNIVETITAEQINKQDFLKAFALYFFIIFFKQIVTYFSVRAYGLYFGRLSLTATKYLYDIAIQKNISFILDNNSGNISFKINNTYDDIREYINTFFEDILQNTILYIGYVGIMFYYSVSLGVLIIIMSILYAGMINYLRPKLKANQKAFTASKDQLFAFITDTVANILLIKSFSSMNVQDNAYNKLDSKVLENNNRMWIFGAFPDAIAMSTYSIFMVVTAGYGGYALINEQITVANFVVLSTIAPITSFYLRGIVSGVNNFIKYQGTIENTLELITEKELEDNSKPNLLFKTGEIEFKNVDFKYHTDEVLTNFNLTIKNKEKIALVGKSGAGKSTIISILQGFYQVDNGQILVENQAVADINLTSLRSHISYIPQEPSLLSRTVYENIAFAKPNATKQEIINAAKLANAHEFIEKLPNAYNEIVGERGFKLSGGQKQRVAIARALLKDAPIIIMDEATSALDSYSEKLIQESLKHLLKDKTCIVIAHRLSTIKAMDRVIVLDNGEIIQDGVHKSLIKKDGLYKELWSLQQEGFIE